MRSRIQKLKFSADESNYGFTIRFKQLKMIVARENIATMLQHQPWLEAAAMFSLSLVKN